MHGEGARTGQNVGNGIGTTRRSDDDQSRTRVLGRERDDQAHPSDLARQLAAGAVEDTGVGPETGAVGCHQALGQPLTGKNTDDGVVPVRGPPSLHGAAR